MADKAYLAWQADTRAGKSSILIGADNETVGLLKERAQADRVAQGEVDPEHTLLLSDGLRAGSGDTVIARGNNRKLVDTDGNFVSNGTLFDVQQIIRRDRALLARRRDTGASVILPGAYLESSVELGYATTAHRSQGVTVDTGHTVITQDRLTRELLYVSMTRGRAGNFAYVSEGDDDDHPAVDPSLQLPWQGILGEVLAAEGAERTAHEVRDTELRKADSLERLYGEYDYLAQIAAGLDLKQWMDEHAPGASQEFEQSPSWDAAVAAWRKATAKAHPAAEFPGTAGAGLDYFHVQRHLPDLGPGPVPASRHSTGPVGPWTRAGGAATARLMIACWARGVPSPSLKPQFGNGAVSRPGALAAPARWADT
ncbi:hypothetical protein [Pseudarthrobacter sp. LT1]|uniref:hypothetical protein n=1 Tax=Pseudarthrobacter sp. LT1 TaxID=3111450 RepID=UPI002D78F869|nr:hypothetical protein [Pseudarthrobacter sp. LT1]WRT15833.1 hypothetical protein VIK36_10240 [Pseudarthrobacter sp. LT1]